MTKWRAVTVILAVVGLACVGVAIYYWVTPAGSLPSFFPGHKSGSNVIHVKHGIAAVIAGVLVLLGAWFASARWNNSGDVEVQR